MKQFTLIALNIQNEMDSNIRKTLKDNWYFFNSMYYLDEDENSLKLNKDYPIPYGFYHKNINIQAIVGMNGSGKSSILDIVYRMINNLAYELLHDKIDEFSENLYSVSGVYAQLFFLIGDTLCCLKCENLKVYLDLGNGFKMYGKQLDITPNIGNDYIQDKIEWAETKIILESFCYSIVSNYSFHAFISRDYVNEEYERGNDGPNIWLDGLFHKNDGYTTPLVLNPYRDKGVINLNTEYNLSNYRLASLLLTYQKVNVDFVDGYKLNEVVFNYDYRYIWDKYLYKTIDDKGRSIDINCEIEDDPNSLFFTYLKVYQDVYSLKFPEYFSSPSILQDAFKYLIYKTNSISMKYPTYYNYIQFKEIREVNDTCGDTWIPNIRKLIEKIASDSSHITLKIRQTIGFIRKFLNSNKIPESMFYCDYSKDYKYDETKLSNLDNVIASFAPPFYQIIIFLDKTSKKGPIEKYIKFNSMSSGERQFLYSVSSILYHIKNIQSIYKEKDRIHYHHINIVMDEIELCFHPELQRTFVKHLCDYLIRLKMTDECTFNLIFSTHSPFILSDIPKCNTLYLSEGRCVNEEINIDTFGANIHDILDSSFFLKNGFVGEFSKSKINEVIDLVLKAKREDRKLNKEDDRLCSLVISMIGEPLVKAKLFAMYREVSGDNRSVLKEEIACLEFKLENKKQLLDMITKNKQDVAFE